MTDKMNVVIVGPVPPPYGGVGNWVLMLDDFIAKRDDINLFHINTAPVSRGLDGRSLWDRVFVQGLIMLKKSNELRRLLRNQKIQAVHITTSGQLAIIRDFAMLKIAGKRGINTVYHLHFGRVPQIAVQKTLEWWFMRKCIKKTNHVVAIDKRTEQTLFEECPYTKTSYIANPCDIQRIDCLTKSDGVYTRKNNEVIFIGWVIKTKGIDELLDAWSNLPDSFADWTLRIVGPISEEYEEISKSQKYSKKKVIFDGEKSHEDAIRLLDRARIAVLPSYTEGFPNFILEAMTLSKAIVATNVGAIPDMIGHCGLLVKPKNSIDLRLALCRAMSAMDLQADMGQKAREKVVSEYSIETIAEQYIGLWSRCSNT